MLPRQSLSVADYLAATPTWEVRHEWVNGEAYAMAGGTPRHAAVATNLLIELGRVCRGRSCRPTNGDQRVFVPATGAFFYPDLSLVCGPFCFAEQDPNSLVNPSVIVEVLSPSTADYDQGAKFDHYRRLPSLQHYVLVDPDRRHVIHLARTAEGWLRRDLHEGEVRFADLDLRLALDEVYADLDAVG